MNTGFDFPKHLPCMYFLSLQPFGHVLCFSLTIPSPPGPAAGPYPGDFFTWKRGCVRCTLALGLSCEKDKEVTFENLDTGSCLSPHCRAGWAHTRMGELLTSDHVHLNCGSPKFTLTPTVVCFPFCFLQSLNRGYEHNVLDTPFCPLRSPLRENERINTSRWLIEAGVLLILGWKDC